MDIITEYEGKQDMTGRIENEIKIEKTILKTLSDMPIYVTEWYYNLRASQTELSSCNNFINKIRQFLLFIDEDVKNIKISKINNITIEKYFIYIQKKYDKQGNILPTSDSYQYGIWCALNNFLIFLTERKYIDTNYISSIKKPKNNDLRRINQNRILLTKDDFSNIIETVNKGAGSKKAIAHQNNTKNRDLTILSLFMTTGMRREALAEINIEDIDFENRILTVIDKGDLEHKYNLSEKVFGYLVCWLEDRKKLYNSPSSALFISGNGKRMTSSAIYKLVCKYCDEALGYHVSPHKLRSGFCSILYQEKGDIEFVRRAVGHSNISTTQRYIVTNKFERQEAANLIDSFL